MAAVLPNGNTTMKGYHRRTISGYQIVFLYIFMSNQTTN